MQAPSRDRDRAAGRSSRWDAHRAQRRRDMVAAAIAAIKRSGPSVTMEEIAAEAGVAKPVLYRVFRDKAELYRAVGSAVAGEALVPALLTELQTERDPRDYVATMIDTYLRLIESEPRLYRFVVHPMLDERPVGETLVGTYKDVIATHLAHVITISLPRHANDAGRAAAWAHALVGMVHEAGDWWIEQGTVTREQLGAQLTALIWSGVSAALPGGPGLG